MNSVALHMECNGGPSSCNDYRTAGQISCILPIFLINYVCGVQIKNSDRVYLLKSRILCTNSLDRKELWRNKVKGSERDKNKKKQIPGKGAKNYQKTGSSETALAIVWCVEHRVRSTANSGQLENYISSSPYFIFNLTIFPHVSKKKDRPERNFFEIQFNYIT